MLSTRQFAEAIGISESSARRLADGGLVETHRTQGGHRKIPLAEALRYVRETHSSLARPDLLGLSEDPAEFSAADYDELLLVALREGNSGRVIGLLRSMYLAGSSIAEICDGPLRFAMKSIGELWPADKRAIYVEHRATVHCVRALHQLRLTISDPAPDAPRALGCAPSGDPYLLPTMMVALALHDCGFNETSLGPDTPISVLADAVEDEKPLVVWLSISTPLHSRGQQREIHQLAVTATHHGSIFALGGRYASDVDLTPDVPVVRCASIQDIVQIAAPIIKREPLRPSNHNGSPST